MLLPNLLRANRCMAEINARDSNCKMFLPFSIAPLYKSASENCATKTKGPREMLVHLPLALNQIIVFRPPLSFHQLQASTGQG